MKLSIYSMAFACAFSIQGMIRDEPSAAPDVQYIEYTPAHFADIKRLISAPDIVRSRERCRSLDSMMLSGDILIKISDNDDDAWKDKFCTYLCYKEGELIGLVRFRNPEKGIFLLLDFIIKREYLRTEYAEELINLAGSLYCATLASIKPETIEMRELFNRCGYETPESALREDVLYRNMNMRIDEEVFVPWHFGNPGKP